MTKPAPQTVETLAIQLDYLLERVRRLTREAEGLRETNRYLSTRLTETSQMVAALQRQRRDALTSLRRACQDLRGPGVPVDDLMKDYLQATDVEPPVEG